MNRALIVLIAFATSLAAAQEAADFRSSAPVTVSGRDPLNRLTLPSEVYRDARPDLSDLRVFNANGEALPVAFAGDPEALREAPPTIELPLFPVAPPPPGFPADNLDVMVKSDRGGTIISVQGRAHGKSTPSRPSAWLVDATKMEQPVSALIVDWEVGPGTQVVRVSVEASDDLRSWRHVASRAALLRLEQGGQVLSQPRVETGSLKAKYLRITGEPAAFALRSVRAQPGDVVSPIPRSVKRVTATAGTKPGEYVVDLGARLPVTGLRVMPAEPNTIAPFTIETRDAHTGPGRRVASATFYRLTREGAELESPPLEIAPTAARYWVMRLDPRSPGIGASMPALEVQWRPAQLVFVARGPGPYSLAFGDAQAKRAFLAVSELIPGYERRAELKLPEAAVGPVATRGEDPMRRMLGEMSPRKAALWAVLVLAVAALGFMAWRLRGQMRAQEASKNAPKA